jgi:hypothetical protein
LQRGPFALWFGGQALLNGGPGRAFQRHHLWRVKRLRLEPGFGPPQLLHFLATLSALRDVPLKRRAQGEFTGFIKQKGKLLPRLTMRQRGRARVLFRGVSMRMIG